MPAGLEALGLQTSNSACTACRLHESSLSNERSSESLEACTDLARAGAQIGVIPARYKSARFPGKALVDILGKPMIVRTWEQACKASSLHHVRVFIYLCLLHSCRP